MNTIIKYEQEHRLSSEDIKNATYDELKDVLITINTEIAFIDSKLTEVKQRAYELGEYADPDWFKRTTLAKKLKGQLAQRIQLELSKKRREQKEKNIENNFKNESTFTKSLLKAMDMYLSPQAKEQILNKAQEIQTEYQEQFSLKD